MENKAVVEMMTAGFESIRTEMHTGFDRLNDKLEERIIKNGEQDTILAAMAVRVETNCAELTRRKRVTATIAGAIAAAIVGIAEIVKKLM